MKTYQFLVPVERASGTRVYHIRAATLKDAKAIYDAGNAECLDEELEV